jgi:hypothetical protein
MAVEGRVESLEAIGSSRIGVWGLRVKGLGWRGLRVWVGYVSVDN